MPALPTVNLTGHWDASVNTALFQAFSGGVLNDNPTGGESWQYWKNLEDPTSGSSTQVWQPFGTAPAVTWENDAVLNLPSVKINNGKLSATLVSGTAQGFTNYLTTTGATVLISFLIDSAGTYPNSPTKYFNCVLIGGERNTYWSLFIRKDGADYYLTAYNYDGTADFVELPITPDEPHTACMRHEGGNLYLSVDCGAESSTASGTTDNSTQLFVGDQGVNSGTTADFKGRIGEIAFYTAGLTGTNLDDARQYFCDKWLTPANSAPVADAGPDQTVTDLTGADLAGSATDDGLPSPPAALTYLWTKISGPGTVTFDDDTDPTTHADFSAVGVYVLQLEASDSSLSDTDTVTITVDSANTAPVANAGPDQTVNIADGADTAGSATDDGLPDPPAALTYAWTKVSGPGSVTFLNAADPTTHVTFGDIGVYVLRLTVSDSVLSDTDDVTITVSNEGPIADAGPDQDLEYPDVATMAGSGTDDGFPIPPGALTYTWTQISGPDTATITDSADPLTTIIAPVVGEYVFQLEVSDGSLSDTDTVTITWHEAPFPLPDPRTDRTIRRLRRAPHISREAMRLGFDKFTLELETGLGLTTGLGSDPQIMLRFSDDGGQTWTSERWVSAGLIGRYKARPIWRRLGQSRDRVFEIVVTDPIPWRIIGADLQVRGGTS